MIKSNELSRTDKDAVWDVFEKAMEHAPEVVLSNPDKVIAKLVKARFALRSICPCCGRRPE